MFGLLVRFDARYIYHSALIYSAWIPQKISMIVQQKCTTLTSSPPSVLIATYYYSHKQAG